MREGVLLAGKNPHYTTLGWVHQYSIGGDKQQATRTGWRGQCHREATLTIATAIEPFSLIVSETATI